MMCAIQQSLKGKFILPVPFWLNTPAKEFWGVKNISLMFAQAAKRTAQYALYGKPDIILDCSGYQLGDPWEAMSKVLAFRYLMYHSYKSKGCRIIMLPQSLGPFKNKRIASVAAGIFHLADLIYTRSQQSYNYAVSVGCPKNRIRIIPDYSVLTPPQMPDDPNMWANRVSLVPSVRMLDKTTKKVKSIYFKSILHTIHSIWNMGLEPVILVHQQEDKALAYQIKKALNKEILIVDPSPRLAKGIIASSRAVVASRYHALVSAMSQGTPAVGTGWTHKYIALFNYYSCEENLIVEFDSEDCIAERLKLIINGEIRNSLITKLNTHASDHKKRVEEMFDDLHMMLNK